MGRRSSALLRYRRARLAGGSYFFTVVTWRRRPILCRPDVRIALRRALIIEREAHPFALDAIVVLPDHLHCIWTLPPGDADFPGRWRRIKAAVSHAVAPAVEAGPTPSRQAKGERGVWQRRYSEHVIRDEDDYAAHVDYIHVNPVRHGLVQRAGDWPWSSLHRWIREGRCAPDWAEVAMRLPDHVGRE